MIIAEDKIFNLMDTNGRRNDVVNAMQIYLGILNNIINEKGLPWNNLPKSEAQYEFYGQALEKSSDVFKKHNNYDALLKEIDETPELKRIFETKDFKKLSESKYSSFRDNLDKNIEARSRHYTSNLVKIGFATERRIITDVGNNLLYPELLKKDEIEKILPLDALNIIYLRQLLKLKIFSKGKDRFYAPFRYAILLLLDNNRISEADFFNSIQLSSPYTLTKCISERDKMDIPKEIDIEYKLSEDIFKKYFKNLKTPKSVGIYYSFYSLFYDFAQAPNKINLDKLLTFYEKEDNKAVLKKAFNYGNKLFKTKRGERPEISYFMAQHKNLFQKNINSFLYTQFIKSKTFDGLREYSDTTKRIFKATGIISFDNGYVELAYKELLNIIFDKEIIKNTIFGTSNEEYYKKYEVEDICYFHSNLSLTEILDYKDDRIKETIQKIAKDFGAKSLEEIPDYISEQRNKEFIIFILANYPEKKVKELLLMFMDRQNDQKIKDIVCPDSSVPTIYEYIIGIAWFYFSGKKINLLKSLNLSLSANFEPLTHAGGGQGDIVIYEKDKVVMLEATLMNASSQKRGEWEPVLRHSANLKIEEETKATGRFVITFFIADELDYNTINIWKAVSAVSLQSSIDKEKITNNVIIMPIVTSELVTLMDKSKEYDKIIFDVKRLFEENPIEFDSNWRKKIMEKIS